MMGACFAVIGLVPGMTTAVAPFLLVYGISYFFTEFGPNVTTFVLPGELFPTRFRATGHGISAGVGKLGAFIGVFLFPLLQHSLGLRGTLLLTAGISVLGALLTLVLPEPAGRSLEEISGEAEVIAAAEDAIRDAGEPAPVTLLASPGYTEARDEAPLPGRLHRTGIVVAADAGDRLPAGQPVQNGQAGQRRSRPPAPARAGDLDTLGHGTFPRLMKGAGGGSGIGRQPEVPPADPAGLPGNRLRLAPLQVQGELRRRPGRDWAAQRPTADEPTRRQPQHPRRTRFPGSTHAGERSHSSGGLIVLLGRDVLAGFLGRPLPCSRLLRLTASHTVPACLSLKSPVASSPSTAASAPARRRYARVRSALSPPREPPCSVLPTGRTRSRT